MNLQKENPWQMGESMEKIQKKDILQQFPSMADWIAEMPQSVMEKCQLICLSRGNVLFSREEEIHWIYLICSGTIIISTGNLDGSEKSVAFSADGQIVGEMEALMHRRNLVYSAKAFSNCVLLAVPLASFDIWVKKDAALCHRLLRALAEKLLNSSESTVQYQNLTARVRFMRLLSHHQPGLVAESRLELAEACGVSERTIHRVVASMAERGELTLQHGKIRISQAQIDRFSKEELE